jgi:hypothetical protein
MAIVWLLLLIYIAWPIALALVLLWVFLQVREQHYIQQYSVWCSRFLFSDSLADNWSIPCLFRSRLKPSTIVSDR